MKNIIGKFNDDLIILWSVVILISFYITKLDIDKISSVLTTIQYIPMIYSILKLIYKTQNLKYVSIYIMLILSIDVLSMLCMILFIEYHILTSVNQWLLFSTFIQCFVQSYLYEYFINKE